MGMAIATGRGMHAVIAFSALTLFAGALLSDWAYASSYQLQWLNFASWLIAAGLCFTSLALLWAALDALRRRATHRPRDTVYLLLLLSSWLLGVLNALVHARDGWATMPTGLLLSALVLLLAAAASCLGLAALFRRPS